MIHSQAEDVELMSSYQVLEIRAEDAPRKSERLATQELVEEFRESSTR